jgi:hypothetical protein
LAAVLGAVALLVGLIIMLAEGEITDVAFAAIAIGVVGVGSWLLIAPDELRDWVTGRQVYYGTGTTLLTIVLIGAVAVGYAWVDQRNVTVDVTNYSVFTLDSSSKQAIETVKQRLAGTDNHARIVAFYPREEIREREAADLIFRQFEEQGDGAIEVIYRDPDENPLLAREFGYGVGEDGELKHIFATYVDEDGDRTGGFEVINAVNERIVSTALLRLTSATDFMIYFTAGHLEYDPASEADFGLQTAYQALAQTGTRVGIFDLTLVDDVPADADAIVIAGAQVPFSQDDVDKIARYIDRGGRMLITTDPPVVDPRLPDQGNTFLLEGSPFSDYLWTEFGLRPQDALVSDVDSSLNSEFTLLIDEGIRQADLLAGFPRQPIVLNLARSIEIWLGDDPNANQGLYVYDVFMITSDAAFGETSLEVVNLEDRASFDENDEAGPLVVGVAAKRFEEREEDIQPRVVIVGDTDWMINRSLNPDDGSGAIPGNALLYSGIIEWLIDVTDFTAPAAVQRNDLFPVTVSDQEQTRIWLITLGVMPGIVLAIGLVVWSLRQRH